MAVPWRQNANFYQKYLFHMLSFYKSRADIKMYLEILLSLATIILFIVLAIKPTLTTIANLSAEVSAKQELAAALDQKIQALSTAGQTFEQNKDKIAVLDQSIPAKNEVASYIKQIEGIALLHSLQVENLQYTNVSVIGEPVETAPTPAQSDNPLQSLPEGASGVFGVFGVSGPYSNILDFLKDVENLRRPMAIDMLAADSAIESGVTTANITLTIKGRLPYLHDSQ